MCGEAFLWRIITIIILTIRVYIERLLASWYMLVSKLESVHEVV